jgi:hypothetical protein
VVGTPQLNLTKSAVLVVPGPGGLEYKAAEILVEEVRRRASIRWPTVTQPMPGNAPLIVLCQAAAIHEIPFNVTELAHQLAEVQEFPADGFRIFTSTHNSPAKVYVIGNDARGVLYGAGFLLRHLTMTRRSILLQDGFKITTAPKYRLRGHQLGYRDKTNSYDGWNLAQWDQYIRELVIFGANAIELIPPRSDDLPDSVHFPLPPLEMMEGMSQIAANYSVDVWIWYPAMDDDYADPAQVEFALKEWEVVYQRLPRIDAILVPGGDPGNTRPKNLMPMLAKQTELLHRYHPQAQMWISAQGFNQEWREEFLSILSTESPDWLSGVVYGPWIHMPIHEFRKLVPEKYPLRNYPDITHSFDCQYPVPDWDLAYALTEGRETINPRPRSQAAIFRQMRDDVIGFLTYSEGCHDDVNKAIWSCLGWDPDADLMDILRQYSRFFIGSQFKEEFALGLLALEHNWVGPLAANTGVNTTLQQFQTMEKAASPHLLKNWRFLQALYRAYYDAYTRGRLLYESSLEEQAMDCLRQVEQLGSLQVLEQAEGVLDKSVTSPIHSVWQRRIYQLAEALFQSIHMQLSVPLYYAQSEVRGANLDGLDYPLNDSLWLKDQFSNIRTLTDEGERRVRVRQITEWTNPGPGGYYLDLSNAYACPYIVPGLPHEEDPGFYDSPMRRFPYWKFPLPIRRAWRGYTGALNDKPFKLCFPNLDPDSHYQVRVVYSDTEEEIKVRLVANETIEIHPFIEKKIPPQPLEFDIPWEATRQGSLDLALFRQPGKGGLGAGQEISEIWIIKKNVAG